MKARILALGLAMTAWVGCTLTRNDVRQKADALIPTLGQGRLIVPKQCALKMAILSRPAGETALNEELWGVADVQAVGDEARRLLETNGLRVGVISGELPGPVRAILEAPPPNQVSPAMVILPDGEGTGVDLGAARPELDLLLARPGGAVAGKRYKEASGWLRLIPVRQGEEGVAVRIMPELHHGPVRQDWGPAPGASSFTPQQLVVRNGQQEETFRDLAATLRLHAGQVAVVGCLPETGGSSLGSFLFRSTEPNSDRAVQKVLLVWASRSDDAPSGPPTPPHLLPADPPEASEAPARRPGARSLADARRATDP